MSEFGAYVIERWKQAYREGGHDDQCEQRERSFLCNCHKRKREQDGLVDMPTEDLYFPPPICPSCERELWHDGDGWCCNTCALTWDSNGSASSVRRTDDNTDVLPASETFGRRLVDMMKEDA